MFFELKIRHAFEESFRSKEELFEFLRREQVVFEMYDAIRPHQFVGQMTYLGDVKSVGRCYRHEKALYAFHYTMQEFEVLKKELKDLQVELFEKWKHFPAW